MQLIKIIILSVAITSLITSPVMRAHDATNFFEKPEHRVWVISGAAVCALVFAALAYYSFFVDKQKSTPSVSVTPNPPVDSSGAAQLVVLEVAKQQDDKDDQSAQLRMSPAIDHQDADFQPLGDVSSYQSVPTQRQYNVGELAESADEQGDEDTDGQTADICIETTSSTLVQMQPATEQYDEDAELQKLENRAMNLGLISTISDVASDDTETDEQLQSRRGKWAKRKEASEKNKKRSPYKGKLPPDRIKLVRPQTASEI
jgi:hypothetical protein